MDRPNVVFLVADMLRRDRVSCYGCGRETTPNIDAFSREATVYDDAVAQGPWSAPSHGSMFTGRYPSQHGATAQSPALKTGPLLPELLSRRGYRTCAVSENPFIRPYTGFGRGFDRFIVPYRVTVPRFLVPAAGRVVNRFFSTPRVHRSFQWLWDQFQRRPVEPQTPVVRNRPGWVERQIDTALSGEDPFFLFINMMDAHPPWEPDQRFYDAFVEDELKDVEIPSNVRGHNLSRHELSERERAALNQVYDASARSIDERVGAVLDRFGDDDDTMIIVTSDHGMALGEFNLVGHQFNLFDPVVSVPLMVRYPDREPGTVAEQVELRRLFHTVLDVAGEDRDLSLRDVREARPAYGEYYTPLVDLEHMLQHGEGVYRLDLMGKRSAFVRDQGHKLVSNHGTEHLYELPESRETEKDDAALMAELREKAPVPF